MSELDDAFERMVLWVHDHTDPIWGDNSRDRTIRALRFLAVSTKKDLASDLIAASADCEATDRWRNEVEARPDPYSSNLRRLLEKKQKRVEELEAALAVAEAKPKALSGGVVGGGEDG